MDVSNLAFLEPHAPRLRVQIKLLSLHPQDGGAWHPVVRSNEVHKDHDGHGVGGATTLPWDVTCPSCH